MNKYVIRCSTWSAWPGGAPRLRFYFKTKKEALQWKREHPAIKAGIQKL